MNTIASEITKPLAQYSQLRTRYAGDTQAVWYYMHASPRPCFTPTLLQNIRDFQQDVVTRFAAHQGEPVPPIQYLVLASDVDGVFNLGGDLNRFKSLIDAQDRTGLLTYATACIDVLYPNAVNLNLPITTISLVQGSALGGGFEAALSSNVLVAERSAQLGLPEILFNLFPGMGAYSLLARRLDAARAERLILSGKLYVAEELHEMGVVDVLAEDGAGEQAVDEFIKRHSKSRNGFRAVRQVRQRYHPITYRELMDITEIWVDAALKLEPKDLRMMERLVRAQNRLSTPESAPARESQHVA